MSQPNAPDGGGKSLALSSAHVFRYILAGLFALVLFGGSSVLPLPGSTVQAHGISSAPGYLSTTIQGNERFYLIDSNAKIICVYGLHGQELKLFSARRFNVDEQIFDGSIKAPIAIEGQDGVTYEQAEQYLKNTKEKAENLKKNVTR
ncbi:MAG TPA: hypothetical protein VEJ63_23405 [Planctomycetota bacterium]|nr:hypothetical protein [Planctomycetota bacterium]